MRICIVVRRRDRAPRQEALERALGKLGYRVSFLEGLPEQPVDPRDVLLVDARGMHRELLARLAALSNRRTFSHILALIEKEERTFRKTSLLEAGVEMIVPWDAAHLEYHLRIALAELFGGVDES